MSIVLMSIASALLFYDWLGHAAAAVAHHRAGAGSVRAAYLWNTYSRFIWPRITNQLHYNLYWSIWHGLTIALFLVAYWSKP